MEFIATFSKSVNVMLNYIMHNFKLCNVRVYYDLCATLSGNNIYTIGTIGRILY